jgi:calcineurin-like phosphoesterase family protein
VEVKTLFTSDTHWGHINIIQYCSRPWVLPSADLCKRCGFGRLDWADDHGALCVHPDIIAHDQALVYNWNSVVGPDDVVFHLGDVAFGSLGDTAKVLSLLNGHKRLIMGNHDRHTKKAYREAGFEEVSREYSLNIDGFRLKLIHDPKRAEDLWAYDAVLCGHVHERWRERQVEATRWNEKKVLRVINVGVDVRRYRPVTLEELRAAGP